MQPPPQAIPSGTAGPPPVGNPRSMFWGGNSPYRRPASNNAPVAPITCPLPPVTDPFALNRQTLQHTPLGSSSKSSAPALHSPAFPVCSQWSGLPAPHTNAGDSSQGPQEPLPGPMSHPRTDAGSFPPASVPSLLPGSEMSRSTEVGSVSGPEIQNPPYPLHYIPGVGPDPSRGRHLPESGPGPDRPLHRHPPHDGGGAPAASAFFSQPSPQMPGQWAPVQGGPQTAQHRGLPCPEGPQATSASQFPSPPNLHPAPAHEPHGPLVSPPAPLAGGEGSEVAHLRSGKHLLPQHTSGQNPRIGSLWASQEFMQNPEVNKHLPDPALVNLLTQGTNPENQVRCPLGTGTSRAPLEASSGSLSMFFQGEEAENEENLSSEKASFAGRMDLDGFSSSPGLGRPPPPAHGAAGLHQAFLKGSSSEAAQQGVDAQPHFPPSTGIQHDKQTARNIAGDTWGDAASTGTLSAPGSQYENVENLEFVQNQEVLPSEPLSVDPLSSNDHFRYGALPGPAAPRPGAVGLSRSGGLHLEAPEVSLHPARSDSVSSSYSGHSHRSPPGSTRPQDLVGTFIQQEIGKPEDDASGSFFKQIDSSPVGGETEETTGSQHYRSSLSQPSTPSPPKPTGIFQTSANSSFEPVKSHLVGVKPVEADRANMVVEVRGTRDHQKKRRAAARMPVASPGNLEQPPDNMETLSAPQACPLPLNTPAEAGHTPAHTAGLPLDTTRPTPEKRPSVRTQGAAKCESPATTLWAQNELPDFGGNVLLAPAAPALYVPAKPQTSEAVQPLAKGVSGQQPRKPGAAPPLQNQDGLGASENLENPPEVGEEEALPSQASSGYASLLSSPPTESLQNQPILIAQPDQSYNLAQPVNFSVSLASPNENSQSWGDAVVGDNAQGSNSQAPGGDSGDHAALSGVATNTVTGLSLSHSAASHNVPRGCGSSEMVSSQPASLLAQSLSHPVPKTLPESQKNHSAAGVPPEFNSLAGSTGVTLVPPASSTSVPSNEKADQCTNREETVGALDFTLNRTLENPGRMYSSSYTDCPASQQAIASHPRQPGPGAHNADRFYQQVTKDAQDQCGLEKAQPELVPPPPQTSPQAHQAPCCEPSSLESSSGQGQSQSSAQPSSSPALADTGQPLLPQPPRSSSASVVSTSSSQPAPRAEQPWLHPPPPHAFGPPPQDLASHYYYRPLYDAYQSQYPSLYLSDPGTASLYYQDIYGLYDPRYRPYDSSASTYMENHRYPEPERPSSRASHCSDRPAARQGYPEGYNNSRSGWSSQSDYYANYYSGQYDYGDSSRWDRYYGPGLRDTRDWDRRAWYEAEHDPYRKETCAYGNRLEKCDDHWRYDPRFTGSFDDDTEPPRDPYGEEVDRRSVHSEHSTRSLRSGHSLPSRRSSLSSHSHQSQIYRSQNVTAGTFEAPPPPGSLHGDYAYGAYGGNLGTTHGFQEYGYPVDSTWPAMEQVPSRPTSPEKFSVPHICARFGPGGHLLKVVPNLPSEGQPALVEIHSLETLLQHTPEQEEMRSFPGPLGKDDTHKVDVINFAQNKATKCLQNESLIDKESASLLWNFIILLCRQNGTVVGTDIAELLLRDHRTVWLPGKSPQEANLIDFTNEAVEQAEEEESGEAQLSFLTDSHTAASSSLLEKETERFRELLLYGRKKDALESAMKNGLWGHALLLASKMDSRTHARVMTRFANSLPINDPLQTVYQLMSGRMPAASTCCGDEKWGDWRPHLAMVLSNLNNNMDVESRTMATMGDTLASKGLLDAAHFCYLMAQVGFGVYTKKTTKLVLIGSNHSLPFLKFATNEAIQRTEAYEYAQSLGAHTCLLPNFQVFKFIYSCRLAEMGLATQAFHYCEVIAKSVLVQPAAFSPVLVTQLVQMASQLRLFDPQLKEKPEEESFVEPAWLVQLRCVEKQIQEGALLWSQDAADPRQCPSTPSSEAEQLNGASVGQPAGLGADNPLLMPGTEPLSQDVQLLPSAPQTLPEDQPAHPARVPMFSVPLSWGPQEPGPGYGSQGSALGLPQHARPDAPALHPGLALPPGAPSLPESGPLRQETRSLDPGVASQDLPVRNALPELSEEDSDGKLALGTSRTAPGLETPPAWDYNSSASTQPAPPLTPTPEAKRPPPAVRKEAKEPKKSESWFSRWLPGKKRTEAYLPDDKNKSIVWDEKKNQWVNLNEPEEEKKAPPPPPTSFPRAPQTAPTGPPGPPAASVNLFSRKAGGSRARYVDVLNPSGTQRNEPALAPADLFAPLAPLPIPSNLLIPNPDAEEPPLADRAGSRGQVPAGAQPKQEPGTEAQELSSSASASGPELTPSRLDGSQGGELSRCSSMSSLSQEVSRHFHQAPSDHGPAGPPPGGAVPFYNPTRLAQASATSGSSRLGRIGQRKYPVLN